MGIALMMVNQMEKKMEHDMENQNVQWFRGTRVYELRLCNQFWRVPIWFLKTVGECIYWV